LFCTNCSDSYNEAKRKLPLAIHKSDLSSADDIIGGITKRKRKCPYEYRGQSLSPTLIMKSKKLKVNNLKQKKISSDSCPPRYQGKIQNVLFLMHL
jgi:hypothetical protein